MANSDTDRITCESEPIHVPGHTQPNGLIIATFPNSRRISHVSANLEASTGLNPANVLGAEIDLVLGKVAADTINAALGSERYAPSNVLDLTLSIPVRPQRKAIVHRYQERVILELEDASLAEPHTHSMSRAQAIISNLRNASSFTELCDGAVQEIRKLTGYDRVMIYRFEPDGSGIVVAEDKPTDLEPYLHLRFPASDIPAQARRLYVLQRVRCIPDVDYAPVPILAAPDAGAAALDMTYSALRGVSPIHREYLRNMGVKATLAVSLIQESALFGMIVCHHGKPFHPSPDMRALCDVIGQLMSVMLQKVREAEDLVGKLARQHTLALLRHEIDGFSSVSDSLARQSKDLLSLVDAKGAMVRCGGGAIFLGQTPPPEQASALVEMIRGRSGETIVGISDAGISEELARACPDVASGILLMPLSNNPGDVIAWFRPEVIQTVQWGGDPRKPMDRDDDERLTPRKSFAAWSEQIRGRSLPWSEADLQAAHELRRVIAGGLLRKAEAELARLSAEDSLTGLANRRALENCIEHWRLSQTPASSALLFIDLDRFKTLNDSFGHAVGDQMLIQAAARLRKLTPAGGIAGRLGGDEFVLFWTNVEQPEAEHLAKRIAREMALPFILAGKRYHASASIGVACSTVPGSMDLMREADAAMYAAKREGGGRAVVFAPILHTAVLSNLQTEQDLFRALEDDELKIHYQPIVTVQDRKLCGFEALIRWHHPDRGWVSPAEFIPRAEEVGLISRIGAWVLAGAIRQAAEWRRRYPSLIMSVNVSARQLTEGSVSILLAGLLRKEGLPADAICIEVTESALMHETSVAELHRVRALGVSVAIDDFGTGYSSLAYLQGLPADTIKIDKQFVSNLGTSATADKFFQAIVKLAQTLDHHVVAEGCETQQQWDVIASANCEKVQGWLIARAMDASTIEQEFLLHAL